MKRKSYWVKRPAGQHDLWKTRPPFLSQLDMELTERCNSNCLHCYINRSAKDRTAIEQELSFSEIERILKEAASLGCLTVRFTGGEPLLRDDFQEIYRNARNLGLRVVIITNGTLITPGLADLFQKIPPLGKIAVSVYGIDRESYESVSRTPGSYAAFRKGIDLLIGNHIAFELKASLLPIDTGKLLQFEVWANAIPGIEITQAPVLSLYPRCRQGEDLEDERIRSLRPAPEEMLKVVARKPKAFMLGLRNFCVHFCSIPGDGLFRCNSGIERGSVDAYGKLNPCLLLRHPATSYDLRSGNLRDAFQNFFPKIRQMKASNPDYLARCARCFLRSLCDQCPAISWLETRTLDGWVEYSCEFTHAQARFIGLLEKGERSWEIDDWQERVNQLLAKYLESANPI